MIWPRVLGLWAGLVMAACGCSSQPPASPGQATGGQDAVDTPRRPGTVSLEVGGADKLRELIARQKGKVVLVDYWATWCGPCVQAFPHTVELANKYRDQGLAAITVSFDQLADRPRVVAFLARHGAWFDNLLSKHDGVSQEAATDFEVEALPQYRLYDRQGKLRYRWEGTSDELEQRIVELLAEKA